MKKIPGAMYNEWRPHTGRTTTPRLPFPLQVDYMHATRYRMETSGADLDWRVAPEAALTGREVLIIDDILDEGKTLAEIIKYCQKKGAANVYTAVLVDKLHDRKAVKGFKADFSGLEAADRFLFGYGMDYKGYWRNAPGIYAVKACKTAAPSIYTVTKSGEQLITQPPQFDWHRCRKLPRFILSSPWREWVLEEGSLTRRLQQASGGDFRVKLVKHCYEVPRQDERKLLQLPMRQCALVRKSS